MHQVGGEFLPLHRLEAGPAPFGHQGIDHGAAGRGLLLVIGFFVFAYLQGPQPEALRKRPYWDSENRVIRRNA